MSANEAIGRWLLVGYQPLTQAGFALPLYGLVPAPNRPSVAITAIDGDPDARIVEFAVVDTDSQTWLPAPHREAEAGSSWIDVFVWAGEVYVGTPAEILEALGARWSAVRRDAPLIAVDLARAAGSADAGPLVLEAFAWLSERRGDRAARRWRALIATQQTRLLVTRALSRSARTVSRSVIRQVEVLARDSQYELEIPPTIVTALSDRGADSVLKTLMTAAEAITGVPVAAPRPSVSDGAGAIVDIVVKGGVLFPDTLIIASSGLKAGLFLTDGAAREAVAQIMDLKLHSSVHVSQTGHGVTIDVREDPILATVTVVENGQTVSSGIETSLKSRPGERYSPSLAAADAERLTAQYDRSGRTSRVTSELRADGYGCALAFIVEHRTASLPNPTAAQNRDVLIVTSGPRAKAISRQFAPPDWSLPTGDPGRPRRSVRWLQAADWGPPGSGEAAVDVVELERFKPGRRAYGLVVWLADDDDLDSRKASASLFEEVRNAAAAWDAPVLIAPALPVRTPSRFLTRATPGPLDLTLAIDTSLARSPLQSRRGKRSLDRRIADLVVGAAVLAVDEPGIRAEVWSAARGLEFRLLSWVPDSRAADELASEASAFALAGRDIGPVFMVELTPTDRRGERTGSLAIDLPSRDFAAFAQHICAEISGPWVPPNVEPVNEELGRTADFPTLMAEAIYDGRHVPRTVVMAETPSLASVRRALSQGLQIARYTDRETLADHLRGETPYGATPAEIRLPKLRRLPNNQGLVVRGIDTRDVRKISVDDFYTLLARYPASLLAAEARGYLMAPGASIGHVVIPLRELAEAARSGDEAASRLLDMEEQRQWDQLPDKRLADLLVSWTPPPAGRRYVLQDAHLPPRISLLNEDQVPAQSMFTIDGDSAVPALFMSRLFEVWAKATISRSQSWSSRMSVTGTFETFPMPPGVVIDLDMQARRPMLLFADGRSGLVDLAEQLRSDLPEISGARTSERAPRHPLLEEIDRELLRRIDLREGATDIDILERLVDMNGHQR